MRSSSYLSIDYLIALAYTRSDHYGPVSELSSSAVATPGWEDIEHVRALEEGWRICVALTCADQLPTGRFKSRCCQRAAKVLESPATNSCSGVAHRI